MQPTRIPRAVILTVLLAALSAAAIAVRASRAGTASLDEPFSLKSRLNSFASPEYFGSVKVRGRRIEVRVDSLRVSVYEPQVWNDLSVRAVLRAPDRSNVDSSDYEELPADSATQTGDDGTVLLRQPWSMSLRVPRGASIAEHRIVLEIITPHDPMDGTRARNPAHLDSLLLRRAVIGAP